jgi:type III secretion system FlhB-like substrate exporter
MDEPQKTRPKAVALRYDAGQDTAPRVVAKGAGMLAQVGLVAEPPRAEILGRVLRLVLRYLIST